MTLLYSVIVYIHQVCHRPKSFHYNSWTTNSWDPSSSCYRAEILHHYSLYDRSLP